MSEHDDAGSAETLPLLLPPPPPQPAARSASAAVTPVSAASEMRFLTSPPRSLNVIQASTDAGWKCGAVLKYRGWAHSFASCFEQNEQPECDEPGSTPTEPRLAAGGRRLTPGRSG